ncbi:flagellar hook capping protein [Desulfovibrio sp. X2]|uniref:flagellar hook assembly protein FlgD n=1 Tax=Desulfovibrio sp. X2 TaxID=941449 RepID=UPI000358E94C|nr:flagellar hook capping FlgD N-terminal domain-containing protein [Desulfovibrio sp. X2]EPR41624.1 flagellar hook capping protein [Desulfovibrio sp. X2]
MIDTTSYINSLAKTASTSATDTTSTDSSSDLGKDDFLTLFVAQLENQDPLNPADNQDMVAQLAQFSSLEQLTNISSTLDSMSSSLTESQQINATSYIGKDVLASGNCVALASGSASNVTYTVPEDASNVVANIYDSSGNIVDSVSLGDVNQGEYDFAWDGKDYDGNVCDDGVYYVSFTGEDENGDSLSISSMVEGEVTGVSMSSGSVVLSLSDGRQVSLSNVYEVNNVTSDTSASDDDSSSSSDDSSSDDSGS